MISRRAMIGITGRALAVGSSGLLVSAARAVEESFLPQGLPAGVYDTATLEALPGKKPLIKLSYRPPNYETPVSHFTSEFTPNDSFFVRYHLAGIPQEIDAAQWRLRVGGEGVGTPSGIQLEGSSFWFRRGGSCASPPVSRIAMRRPLASASACILRVAPSARAANSLLLLPPFPPAAERCALTWVEFDHLRSADRPFPASSRNRFSQMPRRAQRTKRL